MSNQIQHLPVLDNEAVSRLSLHAEVFLHRLLNAVDRYGCFDARIAVLRARLFTFTIDAVTEADISKYLQECVDAGLIKCYTVNGLPYLCINGFKRRLGSYKTPYPAPPAEEGEVVEDGKIAEHNEFLRALFTRRNARQLTVLTERVRHPEIKRAWVKAFNDYLCNERILYSDNRTWLNHLGRWLPHYISRIKTEKQQAACETIVLDFALLE